MNDFLNKIFKNREIKRLEREKIFDREWKKLIEKYEIEEKENYNTYQKYKDNEIKRIKSENNRVEKSKNDYIRGNKEEILNVVKDFVISRELTKDSIGAKTLGVYISGNKTMKINIKFLKPDECIPNIKHTHFLITKNSIKNTYFTNKEKELIYESIIFNTSLYYASLINYYVYGKIDEVIINCYVDGINLANGEQEEKCIFSTNFEPSDINYSKLQFIDSKVFFDSVNARYSLPLTDLCKIIPYSNEKNDLEDYINNDLNGFDFEKYSKKILECNGFNNVYVTKASGDYGADIIAFKDKIKYAIQCKKISSKVGVKAIQEVMASREIYKCHVGAVLTNNYFTPSAKKLAEENKIILWDKDDLTIMLENMNKKLNLPINNIEFNDTIQDEEKVQ